MPTTKQISAFLVNKPGRLANICSALARQKVNIVALSISDAADHGILRLVVDDPVQARKVLDQLGTPCDETDVICVRVAHRLGAIADITTRLADERINIEYLYSSGDAAGRHTSVVLKVDHPIRALHVLGETD